MEESTYTIGEIAKLFKIPASTLRYWEDKEIFSSKRNGENDYREFTLQTTIELLDVVFYRNLNVPIQKMKHFNQLKPEQIYAILEDTERKVKEELKVLEKKSIGIAKRKEQLESLTLLKERGYEKEVFEMEKIVPFDMTNPEDMQIQLEHLANFVLYKENKNGELFQIGLSVPKTHKKKAIWENERSKREVITCLLECHSENFEENNFKEHELALKKLGYSVKQIFASYLATASEKEDVVNDYYKAYLVVERL